MCAHSFLRCRKRPFLPLLFLLFLSACNSTVSFNNQLIRPTATLPPHVKANDIYIDHDGIAQTKEIAKTYPGGLSSAVNPTYSERIKDTYNAFAVNRGQPFIGQSWLWNADSQPHDIVFFCLLNYRQIPCSPEQPVVNLMKFSAFEEYTAPVKLPILPDGWHDLSFVVIRDPYQAIDAIEAEELGLRSETLTSFSSSNIYVNGDATPPEVEALYPKPQRAIKHYSSLFYVSKNPELLEPNGLIAIWLSEERNPGEMVDFYMHFNWQEDFNENLIAVLAFINYEQIPLFYEGEPYLPLYIERRSKSWQKLPLQVQAPTEPGVYELFFLIVAHPFESVETQLPYVFTTTAEDSQKIRLTVK